MYAKKLRSSAAIGILTITWAGIGNAEEAPAAAGSTKTAARPRHEEVGLLSGALIGGAAGGPAGIVVGAGVGAWIGHSVRRANDYAAQQRRSAALSRDLVLLQERATSDQQQSVAAALDGLQVELLFATGSAAVTPQMAHEVQRLALSVADCGALAVRLDGYADPRGSAERNQQLSQQRAEAVQQLLLAAGVDNQALQLEAHGARESSAASTDGYALERRVLLTVRARTPVVGTLVSPQAVSLR